MFDTYRHQGLRKKLVESVRAKGIDNESVLEAIGKVPRHLFMDNAFLEYAYEDKAFPIDCNQTISCARLPRLAFDSGVHVGDYSDAQRGLLPQ